jgi:hypothetical protein
VAGEGRSQAATAAGERSKAARVEFQGAKKKGARSSIHHLQDKGLEGEFRVPAGPSFFPLLLKSLFRGPAGDALRDTWVMGLLKLMEWQLGHFGG